MEEVHGAEVTDKNSLEQIDLLIRKGSHFFEYLVLSILLVKAGEVYGVKLKTSIPTVLFICLLIANLDELYQSFVPGRNSLVTDSLIDLSGAVMGMVICVGISRLIGNVE